MKPPKQKDPFKVKLSPEKEEALTKRLVDEIRHGLIARSVHMQEYGLYDFYWSLYEQQSQRGISRDTPRYGSADLTSPIGTENVDALAARATKTIFVEPLYIVEGVGESATKAPAVEEFMQWRQEEIRLQKTMKRVITSSLVETGAIVEVIEDGEPITRVEVVKALPMTDEMGLTVLDPKTGKPMPAMGPDGLPVEAPDGAPEFVEVKRTWQDYRRRGASVRRRGLKDFLFLPAHAEDEREVWAHATRFYEPMDEIQRKADRGLYRNIEALAGSTHERDTRAEQDRARVTVEVSHGEEKSEKELWRVQFWYDLGHGLSCYIAIVSERHNAILALQCDWLQRWRTIYVNPYPCPYSVWGYSMIGTKLLTTIEEHTAWRNMNADRDTLEANAPLKRLHGAQWDPQTQPFGAGRTIDVARMDEVMPFEFKGSSVQAMNKEAACVTDAQRIIGMNDIAIGQMSSESRTLGENELATQQSFTRTDDPISNIQEAMEEIGAVMHAIEVQALREQPDGLAAPPSVIESVQYRTGDTSFAGTFTPELISGSFRFKPRGSVESADPALRIRRENEGIDSLMKTASINPHVAMRLASPEMASAFLQNHVTNYKPRDKQPFLAPIQPPQPMLPPGMPMDPAMGGGEPDFGGGQLVDQLLGQLPQGGVQ